MIRHSINPFLRRGFQRTCAFLLRQQFGDFLIDNESVYGGLKPWPRGADIQGPLFFVVNHTSWWDAICAGELCLNQQKLRAIGPMDAVNLKKSWTLSKIGMFGTSPGDGEETSLMLDEEFRLFPETCVWVHAQGQFVPNEERFFKLGATHLKTGIARWSNKAGSHRIPVALHYAFGPERKPLAFVRFGADVTPTLGEPTSDAQVLGASLIQETDQLLLNVARAHKGHAAHYEGFTSLFRRTH